MVEDLTNETPVKPGGGYRRETQGRRSTTNSYTGDGPDTNVQRQRQCFIYGPLTHDAPGDFWDMALQSWGRGSRRGTLSVIEDLPESTTFT